MLCFSNLGNEKFWGYLGNQLFEIASTIGIAEKNNVSYSFPEWKYSKYFKNKLPIYTENNFKNVINEKQFNYYDVEVSKDGNTDLKGWFQSEKYFEHCKEKIKECFIFEESFIEETKKKLFYKLTDKKICAISIKRGAYVNNFNYYDLGIDYYLKALKYIPEDCYFVIFSDDYEWCKQYFKGDNFYFAENHNDIEQLCMLSLCDHFIIANSTFSWWGAWLGEKEDSIIIAPCNWFGKGLSHLNSQDVIPDRWKKYYNDGSMENDKRKYNKFKVIVPFYNCSEYIVKCLSSIFIQTYTNFDVIIIDDCSTDDSLIKINNFISKVKPKQNIKIFKNKTNCGALANIVYGINNAECSDEDIIIQIDGDDWLYSAEVFNKLNVIYQEDVLLTYGSLVELSTKKLNKTFTKKLFDTQKYRKQYGEYYWVTSHLKTFKYKLWKKILDKDLRDINGTYFKVAWDLAMMYPMIEMAGLEKIVYVEEPMYIYNDLNPANDYKIRCKQQAATAKYIKNKKEYSEIIF